VRRFCIPFWNVIVIFLLLKKLQHFSKGLASLLHQQTMFLYQDKLPPFSFIKLNGTIKTLNCTTRKEKALGILYPQT
jgi:hypothetical protein